MTLIYWLERHVIVIIDNFVSFLLSGDSVTILMKMKKNYTENSQCIVKNDVENQVSLQLE